MSTIKVTHQQPIGTNVIAANQIKKVSIPSTSQGHPVMDESQAPNAPVQTSEAPAESAEERRARKREEYSEAARIRERALQMQKQAEDKIKQAQEFVSLKEQAKDDPRVLAKILGMSEEELQRKFFNKMYNIAEEKKPEVPETFEEATARRLEQYEKHMQEDKERRMREAQEFGAREAERIKHQFITDNILPAITEDYEFIHKNGKEACAGTIYDLMNHVYQECLQTGKEFTLKPIDVVNQLEEELGNSFISQLESAKGIKKLSKFFKEEVSENEIPRKNFQEERRPSPTLSSSYSAPSVALPSTSGMSEQRLGIKDRNARRERAKRNLGST